MVTALYDLLYVPFLHRPTLWPYFRDHPVPCYYSDIVYVRPKHLIMSDIFVNCSWVDTRWQQYSTVHIYTQTQYTEQHN